MAKKFATHINLQKNELQNAVIQVLASDPSSPAVGQIYFNSTDQKLKQYTSGGWIEYGTGAGAGDMAKATYDADNDGIVDNSEALGGQSSAYHLSRTNHTGTQTASTISDFDTQVRTNRLDQMAAPTADVSANNHKITNVSTPTNNNDAANKAYVDGILASNDAMVLKGSIDASSNPNYPAASAGDTYKISVAGKIGGASGIDVQVGDTIYCITDGTSAGNQATVGANWTIVQANVDRATTTTLGLAEYATQAEAEAKSATDVAVTPASIANFTQKKLFTIGTGAATSINCTHNLGTTDVAVSVYEVSTGDEVECDVTRSNANTVALGFAVAPATNSLKVVIIG